jgi:UDP-N-acetylmuramoyl-tripeptide--D-alanyl-D-alanine ligase
MLGRMPVSGRGRRIAVLGDMLELGDAAPELHKGLADAVTGNGIDLVFCLRSADENPLRRLAIDRRGAYAAQASSLDSPMCSMRSVPATLSW